MRPQIRRAHSLPSASCAGAGRADGEKYGSVDRRQARRCVGPVVQDDVVGELADQPGRSRTCCFRARMVRAAEPAVRIAPVGEAPTRRRHSQTAAWWVGTRRRAQGPPPTPQRSLLAVAVHSRPEMFRSREGRVLSCSMRSMSGCDSRRWAQGDADKWRHLCGGGVSL